MVSHSTSLYNVVTSILLVLILQYQYTQAQLCAPFPPYLPISGPLIGSPAIVAAADNFTATIAETIETYAIGDSNDTSFSVDFYSLHDGSSLFNYHYTGINQQNATQGVTKVDSNTIYRIGSISKVFTVYTYLANVGDVSWNQPITKYVPELAEAAQSSENDSPVDAFRWEDITIGALASQLGGVPRDVYEVPQLSTLGLPPAPATNISYCDGTFDAKFPCDRACKSQSPSLASLCAG